LTQVTAPVVPRCIDSRTYDLHRNEALPEGLSPPPAGGQVLRTSRTRSSQRFILRSSAAAENGSAASQSRKRSASSLRSRSYSRLRVARYGGRRKVGGVGASQSRTCSADFPVRPEDSGSEGSPRRLVQRSGRGPTGVTVDSGAATDLPLLNAAQKVGKRGHMLPMCV